MSPDRYGDPAPRSCRNPNCRKGWVGTDDEGRPIPCLDCKPHLATTATSHDFAERTPSARAQAAINAEEANNQ
jgi:hypothetical protein